MASATDVNTKNGLTSLIKTNNVFENEKIDEAYLVYSKFANFQKSNEISMTDLIIECEYIYQKMIDYEMSLPILC